MKDHRKERAEARKKAEKLVSQMTLLEKASQLKYDAAPVKRLGVPAYNTGMKHCMEWPEQVWQPCSHRQLRWLQYLTMKR